MITERHEELAALHAFGLLEGDERVQFETELTESAELRLLVASLSETATSLALVSPPVAPPPELKQRILARVEEPAPDNVVAVSSWRFIPWGLAAALAIVSLWLGSRISGLKIENESLTTERQLAEIALKAANNQLAERSLLAETMITDLGRKLRHSEDLARLKVAALASLAGNTKEAQAIAVWDPDQQSGLLTFDKLPVITDAQDYQIWVVDPAYPDPVSGGLFRPDSSGRATLVFRPDQPIRQAAAFAISLEKKGGVKKAEGTIVLLGKSPSL